MSNITLLDTPLPLPLANRVSYEQDLDGPITFRTLRDAEQAANMACNTVENSTMQLARIVWAIRDQRLWVNQADPDTGDVYSSFDKYLESMLNRVGRMPTTAKSTVYGKLACISVYEQQLDYGGTFLKEMGEHASQLLRAANVTPKGSELLDEDKELETGGVKLGKEGFVPIVESVYQNVKQAANDPSFNWKVKDTKALVDGLLGVTGNEKAKLEWHVQMDGDNTYRLMDVRVYVGDFVYNLGDKVDIDTLKVIGKGANVEGVPEGWR